MKTAKVKFPEAKFYDGFCAIYLDSLPDGYRVDDKGVVYVDIHGDGVETKSNLIVSLCNEQA